MKNGSKREIGIRVIFFRYWMIPRYNKVISLYKIIQALCLCIISLKTCVIVTTAYKCVAMFTDE